MIYVSLGPVMEPLAIYTTTTTLEPEGLLLHLQEPATWARLGQILEVPL